MNRHYKNRKIELRPRNLFALRTPEDNPMLQAVAIALSVAKLVEVHAEPAETVELDTPRAPKLRKRSQLRPVFAVVYNGTVKFGN